MPTEQRCDWFVSRRWPQLIYRGSPKSNRGPFGTLAKDFKVQKFSLLQVPGAGRGLIATVDVPMGAPLMFEKPMSCIPTAAARDKVSSPSFHFASEHSSDRKRLHMEVDDASTSP